MSVDARTQKEYLTVTTMGDMILLRFGCRITPEVFKRYRFTLSLRKVDATHRFYLLALVGVFCLATVAAGISHGLAAYGVMDAADAVTAYRGWMVAMVFVPPLLAIKWLERAYRRRSVRALVAAMRASSDDSVIPEALLVVTTFSSMDLSDVLDDHARQRIDMAAQKMQRDPDSAPLAGADAGEPQAHAGARWMLQCRTLAAVAAAAFACGAGGAYFHGAAMGAKIGAAVFGLYLEIFAVTGYQGLRASFCGNTGNGYCGVGMSLACAAVLFLIGLWFQWQLFR